MKSFGLCIIIGESTSHHVALLLTFWCVTSARAFEVQSHCKMKPGCVTSYQCDSMPEGWNEKQSNIEESLYKKEFPITCDNKELWNTFKEEMDTLKTDIEKVKLANRELEGSLEENQKKCIREIDTLKTEIEKIKLENRELNKPLEENQDKPSQDNCELEYDGKCYRAILHDKQDVNFAEAETMCHKIGWKLANIYSKEHYDILVSYLRTKVSPVGYATTWLGMTYDPSTKKMYLSDGTRSIYEFPWYPGFPYTSPDKNKMNIDISRSPTAKYQGMANHRANAKRRGALCER